MEIAENALWVTPEQQWLEHCAPELGNVRAALDWSKEHEPTLAIRLAGASFELFNGLALLHESRRRSDLLYSLLPSLSAPLEGEARFLRMRSLHMRDVSLDAQLDLATQSAALYRKQGDARGLMKHSLPLFNAFKRSRRLRMRRGTKWPVSSMRVGHLPCAP